MLSEKEKLTLAALAEKKKTQKLNGKEFAVFKKLNSKQKESNNSHYEGKGTKFVPGNDFAWWDKHHEILKDVANLLSNFIPGTNVFRGTDHSAGVVGAMLIECCDVYGGDERQSDPLNTMARDLFLKMFQKWRGITSYQYTDLAILLIAGNEVFKLISELERLYAVCKDFRPGDQNFPYVITEACGWPTSTVEYVRTHLSKFRADLNMLILTARKICIPKDWSVLADKLSLYGYLYKDHDDDKAQVIAFVPHSYGVFDETTFNTGSSIIFEKRNASRLISTVESYNDTNYMFPLLDEMISALVNSDSANKIYGDLLTWFGEEQLVVPLYLPEDYSIQPVYSESMLHKIHNMDIVGLDMNEDSVSIFTPIPFSIYPLDNTAPDYAQKVINANNFLRNQIIYQKNGVIGNRILIGFLQDSSTPGENVCTCQNVYNDNRITIALSNQNDDATLVPHTWPAYKGVTNVSLLDTYREAFTLETVTEGLLFKNALSYEVITLSDEAGTIQDEDYYYTTVLACGFEIITHVEAITKYDNGYRSAHLYTNVIETLQVGFYKDYSRFVQLDWTFILYEMTSAGGLITNIAGDVCNLRSVTNSDITRVLDQIVLSGFTTDITPRPTESHK